MKVNWEALSKVRPVWLVSGVAALTILSVCSLVALCGVVALVWYSSQTTSRAAEATQIVYVRQTAQATNTIPVIISTLRPTPTQLPLGSRLIPSPFLVTPPGQTVGQPISPSGSTPDDTVRSYYQMVSEGQYVIAWSMLTDQFKQKFNCCAPDYNYTGYLNWWNSVDYVELGSVTTVSQDGDRAVVYAELDYVMNGGGRSSDRDAYIHLVYDNSTNSWRFDDKGSSP